MVDAALFPNGLGKKFYELYFSLRLRLFQSWLGAGRETEIEKDTPTHSSKNVIFVKFLLVGSFLKKKKRIRYF